MFPTVKARKIFVKKIVGKQLNSASILFIAYFFPSTLVSKNVAIAPQLTVLRILLSD